MSQLYPGTSITDRDVFIFMKGLYLWARHKDVDLGTWGCLEMAEFTLFLKSEIPITHPNNGINPISAKNSEPNQAMNTHSCTLLYKEIEVNEILVNSEGVIVSDCGFIKFIVSGEWVLCFTLMMFPPSNAPINSIVEYIVHKTGCIQPSIPMAWEAALTYLDILEIPPSCIDYKGVLESNFTSILNTGSVFYFLVQLNISKNFNAEFTFQLPDGHIEFLESFRCVKCLYYGGVFSLAELPDSLSNEIKQYISLKQEQINKELKAILTANINTGISHTEANVLRFESPVSRKLFSVLELDNTPTVSNFQSSPKSGNFVKTGLTQSVNRNFKDQGVNTSGTSKDTNSDTIDNSAKHHDVQPNMNEMSELMDKYNLLEQGYKLLEQKYNTIKMEYDKLCERNKALEENSNFLKEMSTMHNLPEEKPHCNVPSSLLIFCHEKNREIDKLKTSLENTVQDRPCKDTVIENSIKGVELNTSTVFAIPCKDIHIHYSALPNCLKAFYEYTTECVNLSPPMLIENMGQQLELMYSNIHNTVHDYMDHSGLVHQFDILRNGLWLLLVAYQTYIERLDTSIENIHSLCHLCNIQITGHCSTLGSMELPR